MLRLADIEEAETGDQGRIRHWLAQAVRAPRDPKWTADGYVSDRWAPVSPVTGAIGAFEWRVPLEQLGPVVEAEADPVPPPPPPPPPPVEEPVDVEPVEAPAVTRSPPPPPVDAVPEEVPLTPPLPDDPGVEDEEPRDDDSGRFRLF